MIKTDILAYLAGICLKSERDRQRGEEREREREREIEASMKFAEQTSRLKNFTPKSV
jgi:hypothetical protein